MLDFKQIQELIKLVNKTNTTEVKIEQGDFKILIRGEQFSKQKNAAQMPIMAPIAQAPAFNQQVAAEPEASPAASSESGIAKAAAETANNNYVEIKSPMIGTFYRAASPEDPPFIKVGDSIETGNVLCIVEAMKLFNEIEAEISGTIVKVLIENASPVEYDTPLFLVDPA